MNISIQSESIKCPKKDAIFFGFSGVTQTLCEQYYTLYVLLYTPYWLYTTQCPALRRTDIHHHAHLMPYYQLQSALHRSTISPERPGTATARGGSLGRDHGQWWAPDRAGRRYFVSRALARVAIMDTRPNIGNSRQSNTS